MPLQTYTTPCLYNKKVARDVWEFAIEKPEGFTFKPGQFVLFQVPLLDNPTDIQPRAFSIASAPHEKHLLFIAKMTPNGRASRWIAEFIKEETPISFQGPFGNFVLQPEKESQYMFVATSTGMAPFRSMVEHMREQKMYTKTDIVFGVRSEEDLFWVDELRAFSEDFESVQLHLALSQPSPAWEGHTGRVQSLIPLIQPDMSQTSLYVCGSPVMTKEIKDLALGAWGMPKERVHAEGYI